MRFKTDIEEPISQEMVSNYLGCLINSFFKILPIRENNESSLNTYMKSLQAEMLGFKNLILAIREDSMYMSLLSILQYLIDNPDCPVPDVKREVFKAISICNKLSNKYRNGGDSR